MPTLELFAELSRPPRYWSINEQGFLRFALALFQA
jgi:hypothetical protein